MIFNCKVANWLRANFRLSCMEFIIYHPIKRKYTNENKTFWCSAQVPSQINFHGIKVFETDKNLSAKSHKLLTFTKRLVHTTQFLVISSFSCTRTHILHWRYVGVLRWLKSWCFWTNQELKDLIFHDVPTHRGNFGEPAFWRFRSWIHSTFSHMRASLEQSRKFSFRLYWIMCI